MCVCVGGGGHWLIGGHLRLTGFYLNNGGGGGERKEDQKKNVLYLRLYGV